MGKYKAIIAILVVLILAAIAMFVYVVIDEKKQEQSRLIELNQNSSITSESNIIKESTSEDTNTEIKDNVSPSVANTPSSSIQPNIQQENSNKTNIEEENLDVNNTEVSNPEQNDENNSQETIVENIDSQNNEDVINQ